MDFNRFFRFLFINSTINSLISIRKNRELRLKPELATEALNAKSIYKMQIRRYLGLGFLLSFIPGTEAFKSREALLNSIVALEFSVFLSRPALYVVFRPLFIIYRHLEIMIDRSFAMHTMPSEDDLQQPIEKAPDGLNSLNPFFYVLHFFSYLCMQGMYQSTNFIASLNLSPLLTVSVMIPVILFLWLFTFIPAIISFVLFIGAELVLNSLNTLLIEPLKFAFEAIFQLIQTWEFEFAYLPTVEANKLNNLIEAVETLNTKDQFFIQTSKSSLIANSVIEKHHNSFFFERNKNSNLFYQPKPEIQKAYNGFTNLKIFTYFTQIQMLDVFPKELTKFVLSLFLELDSLPKRENLYIAEYDENEYKALAC